MPESTKSPAEVLGARGQSPSKMAVAVTEAAMLAALETMKDGETISPDRQEAIAVGLMRAACRWWSMTTPAIPEADDSAHRGFALCLTQERQFQRQASIRGGEA